MSPDHLAQPPIYLDNHATTPIDPRVASIVWRFLTEDFGNAHSRDHCFGDAAEIAVDAARREVALLVDARPQEVVFTSGATEAINIVLNAIAQPTSSKRALPRLAVTAAEHSAVLDTARALARQHRIALTVLPVDRLGHVELEALETACRAGLDAVAVIAANNEVGTITDLAAVAQVAHTYGALFVSDATQAAGKIPIRVGYDAIDVLAFSAHKIYGPKGVGALVSRPGVALSPLTYGGGQEGGLRSGTLNVSGIAGFGEAARLRRKEIAVDEAAIATRRNRLQTILQQSHSNLVVNGKLEARLAGNLHIAFPGVPNQAIIARIRERVALSTGSACSSGIEGPSHVLRAMGVSDDVANGALRFGVGKFVSMSQIETAAAIVLDAVNEVLSALGARTTRSPSRFESCSPESTAEILH